MEAVGLVLRYESRMNESGYKLRVQGRGEVGVGYSNDHELSGRPSGPKA